MLDRCSKCESIFTSFMTIAAIDEENLDPVAPLVSDSPQCRICYDGEDVTKGKLFSPCKCTGSMRYIHTECLDTWRSSASNPKSAYRCEQCRYRYRFAERNVKLYAVLMHPVLPYLLTAVVLFLLVWLLGFIPGLTFPNITNNPFVNHMLRGFTLIGCVGVFFIILVVALGAQGGSVVQFPMVQSEADFTFWMFLGALFFTFLLFHLIHLGMECATKRVANVVLEVQ